MRALVLAVALTCCWSTAVSSQQAQLPAELKLPLLVKVLSFDRGIASLTGDIVVAVIYQAGVPASLRERDVWLAAARQDLRLNGHSVRVAAIDYQSSGTLVTALRGAHATVVFVSPMRSVDAGHVAEHVRAAGFRTATDSGELVSQSTSLGLLLRDGRPHIVINMALATREGADYSAQLLRVAEVVR